MYSQSKFNLMLLAILLFFGIVLAACDDNETNGGEAEGQNDGETNQEEEEPADDEDKLGGTLVGAMDTAPQGIFNPVFYEEAYEANILDFTHESLLSQNEELAFEGHLAHDWDINDDQTEITLHLEEDVTWHDGEPFTADDVVFTYKTIATPGYTEAGGVREEYANKLVGYEEFNSGDTDEYEGVEAEDDHTVTFYFEDPNVTILKDVSFSIIPEHVFEGVDIDEIPEHTATLEPGEVIGTGPFIFSDMLEREQYVLEKNEDYWKGEPNLDEIQWKVIEQSVMLGLLEKGEIDFIGDPTGVPPADYETVEDADHIKLHEQTDFGFQMMGFKMNYRTDGDVDDGTIEPDNWVPNEDMDEKLVRQALAYAIDREGIVEELLHGHGSVINAPIAQQFWAYDDAAVKDYEYDPEKAEELLDEAGYVDDNDDGNRNTPDGEEWVVNFNYPTGNELREKAAPIIADFIEEIDVQVDLRQPKEMTAFQTELTEDNTDWDLYLIGFSLGSGDPDPSGLWKRTAGFNFSRWNNEKSDDLIAEAMEAPEAFEQSFREEKYSDWQEVFSEEMPALLLFAQNKIYGYNDRVQGFDPMPYGFNNDPELWWVKEEE